MKLVLMRHAKAAAEEGQPDHDRPLTEQGVRDARTMGTWLREHDVEPEVVWSSSALRARQTWSAVAPELSAAPEPSYLRSVYEAGPGDLLDLLRDVSTDVGSILVVGHNPTMQQVLAGLIGDARDFPASAVAVIEVSGPWSALTSGRLLHLGSAKDA